MFDAMIVSTGRDFLAFAAVFVCGQCTGLVFDLFRAFRCAHTPGRRTLALQDTLLCAIAFYMFSYTADTFAGGDLRWYVFAGFILGVVLYFLCESRFVLCVFSKIFIFVFHIFSKGFGLLKSGARLCAKPFGALFVKMRSFFKKILKKNPFLRKFFNKKSLQADKNSL